VDALWPKEVIGIVQTARGHGYHEKKRRKKNTEKAGPNRQDYLWAYVPLDYRVHVGLQGSVQEHTNTLQLLSTGHNGAAGYTAHQLQGHLVWGTGRTPLQVRLRCVHTSAVQQSKTWTMSRTKRERGRGLESAAIPFPFTYQPKLGVAVQQGLHELRSSQRELTGQHDEAGCRHIFCTCRRNPATMRQRRVYQHALLQALHLQQNVVPALSEACSHSKAASSSGL
jgi:hypothetical protein